MSTVGHVDLRRAGRPTGPCTACLTESPALAAPCPDPLESECMVCDRAKSCCWATFTCRVCGQNLRCCLHMPYWPKVWHDECSACWAKRVLPAGWDRDVYAALGRATADQDLTFDALLALVDLEEDTND